MLEPLCHGTLSVIVCSCLFARATRSLFVRAARCEPPGAETCVASRRLRRTRCAPCGRSLVGSSPPTTRWASSTAWSTFCCPASASWRPRAHPHACPQLGRVWLDPFGKSGASRGLASCGSWGVWSLAKCWVPLRPGADECIRRPRVGALQAKIGRSGTRAPVPQRWLKLPPPELAARCASRAPCRSPGDCRARRRASAMRPAPGAPPSTTAAGTTRPRRSPRPWSPGPRAASAAARRCRSG